MWIQRAMLKQRMCILLHRVNNKINYLITWRSSKRSGWLQTEANFEIRFFGEWGQGRRKLRFQLLFTRRVTSHRSSKRELTAFTYTLQTFEPYFLKTENLRRTYRYLRFSFYFEPRTRPGPICTANYEPPCSRWKTDRKSKFPTTPTLKPFRRKGCVRNFYIHHLRWQPLHGQPPTGTRHYNAPAELARNLTAL